MAILPPGSAQAFGTPMAMSVQSVAAGILVAAVGIALPGLGHFGARVRARDFLCLSNLRQIGLALNMYCNDNKGQTPALYGWFGGYGFSVTMDFLTGQAGLPFLP